jgi:hypothetical protein
MGIPQLVAWDDATWCSRSSPMRDLRAGLLSSIFVGDIDLLED